MVALKKDEFQIVKKIIRHDKFDSYAVDSNGETLSDIARYVKLLQSKTKNL